VTHSSTVYFLAEYPADFAIWAGIVEVLKRRYPEHRTVLITAREPLSRIYDLDEFGDTFDVVKSIRPAAYVGGVGFRQIHKVFLTGFRAARKTVSDLAAIGFESGSVVFVMRGTTLTSAIFLKLAAENPGVNSVVLKVSHRGALLRDYIPDQETSLLNKLYNQYFGTYAIDHYFLRREGDVRVRAREYVFTSNPANFVFYLTHALPVLQELQEDEFYFPWPHRDTQSGDGGETVVFFGQPFHWQRDVAAGELRERLNSLLDVIRARHPDAKLIYKPHPGELKEHLENLKLDDFEIEDSTSAEMLLMRDSTITHTYSVWSAATLTSLGMGVRSHMLFGLFDASIIPDAHRRYARNYFGLPSTSKVEITSEEEWLSGNSDYSLEGIPVKIVVSVVSMLDVIFGKIGNGNSSDLQSHSRSRQSGNRADSGNVNGVRLLLSHWRVRLATVFTKRQV
jgi:hypothetical protein